VTAGPPEGALAVALELADAADELTTTGVGAHGRHVASRKHDGTWVTEVDRAVERRLRAIIADRFPGHAVLGEEDGRSGPDDAPTWVIDPIDGTSNYVRGNPVWATLVGLQVDGDDVLGVVSAPALGHRWTGVVGEGATLDGGPIGVSGVASLAEAEVSFGDLDWFRRDGRWDEVAALVDATERVRSYGDFWAHCLVASGSTELAAEAAVSPWDLCAVRALVRAAGGRCTALDGAETSSGGDVLSSNGLLHGEALAFFHSRP
jgi:histidinol-phosphatase